MAEPQAPAVTQQPVQQPEQPAPSIAPQRPEAKPVVTEPQQGEKRTIPPEIPYAAYHMAGMEKYARGGWKRISMNTIQSDDNRFTITQIDPTRRSKWFLLKDMETGESYEETTMTGAKKTALEIRGEEEDTDVNDFDLEPEEMPDAMEHDPYNDHQYCEKCGECTTCNLRPCIDGEEHQVATTKQGGMYDNESMGERSKRMGQKFLNEVYRDDKGIIRWRSNHLPVPQNLADEAENSPYGTVMDETPNLRGRRSRGWAETSNEISNTETPSRTAKLAVEETMATPIQGSKQKAAASKWARLRQVAAEEPDEADAAITEVAEALGTMAEALTNLKENLDLIEAPKTASIKARLAASHKYADTFRHMAEESPEVVADAISEVYHSLDDVAGALENLAEHMGIELSLTPAEEAIGEEGKAELEGEWGPEEPESGAEPKVDEEKFEEAKEELESPEDAPAEEKLDEAIDKEAADGSDPFVSDRDEEGQPKAPVIAAEKHKHKCPECGKTLTCNNPKDCPGKGKEALCGSCPKKKKADGGAAFITDRDNAAKPAAPAKVEAPEAQGETEVGKAAAKRAAVRARIAKRWGVEL